MTQPLSDAPDELDKLLPDQVTVTPRPDTQEVTSAVRALFDPETITDEADRRIVKASMDYLDNPTGSFEELSKHISALGESLYYAEVMQEPLPFAVYETHYHLITLEVRHHVNVVKALLREAPGNHVEILHSLAMARDAATVLFKGYRDRTFLQEVNLLGGDDLQWEALRSKTGVRRSTKRIGK